MRKIVLASLVAGSLVGGVIQHSAFTAPAEALPSEQAGLAEQKSGDWDQLKYNWTTPANGSNYTGTVVGNGRIGARIAGGVAAETLQLNDSTFWSGEPVDYSDASRQTDLAETRRLLAAADTAATVGEREALLKQAEEAAKGMWGRPSYNSRFLPIGKMLLDVPGTSGYAGYSRELDLDRATVTTKYTVGSTRYTREVFANHPDNVIVMRISNDKNEPMSLTAKLAPPAEMAGHASVQAAGNEITMTGTAPYQLGQSSVWADGRGMTFDSRVRVQTVGGTVAPTGGDLAISNANEIVLTYSSATSYKDPFTLPNPSQGGNDPAPIVEAVMDAAEGTAYNQLLDTHLADYRSLFRRLWVEVNGNTAAGAGNIKTYQYSRYEMIASSRADTTDRPHNQQGLWNPEWVPSNDSSHFLNENVEKYYANIETANLSELGDPLWKWIGNVAQNGAVTAEQDFGFDGWMAPHYSDIWATTALSDGDNEWAIWPMGGVWLSSLVYDHYLFTRDEAFLEEDAYPLLKGAAEFALDLLVTDKNGHLVTSPSTSPEHKYRLSDGTALAVSQGTTGDMSLIRQLFHDVLDAAETLEASSPEDVDLIDRIEAANAKLLPFATGSQGELKEWNNDYAGVDASHRHASHLLGVSLRDVITKRGEPELFAAAKKALELRGSGGYHPDKSFMRARLGEPDKAVQAHSLFSVDPNLNKWAPLSAYLPELFVQSHEGEIELLPSLPTGWDDGRIDGVKTRGGHELSLEWADGAVTAAALTAATAGEVTLRGAIFRSNVAIVDSSGDPIEHTTSDGTVTFTAEAGERYAFEVTGSVSIDAPASLVGGKLTDITVAVSSTDGDIPGGDLELEAPEGWGVFPASQTVGATGSGSTSEAVFQVRAPLDFSGRGTLNAVLTADDGSSLSASRGVGVTNPGFVPCTDMTVTAFSSQETAAENRPASNVVDCAVDPGWTTAWSVGSTPPPHWVVVDLGSQRELVAAGCTARTALNGRINAARIETSLDGQTWTQSVEGTFANSTDPQWLALDGSKARYVRMTGLTSYSGPWISCGEFNAKVAATADPDPIALDVAVVAETRCIGSKAYVSVKATSHESMPVALRFETPYGVKSFTSVAPDASATHAFASRKVSIPAGTATVTATADVGGQPVTAISTVDYAARNCAG